MAQDLEKITITLVGDGFRREYNDASPGEGQFTYKSVRQIARAVSREALMLWEWLDEVTYGNKEDNESSEGK